MLFTRDQRDALADEVLTFIEQREAEQIAYGFYDVTLSGAEVITGFQPIDGSAFAIPDREGAIGATLQRLVDEVQIIRLNNADQPAGWVFRSRVAEIVRLLTKLRQRRARTPSEKSGHRVSKSKRLVEDVKFHVAARRVPRRDIPARDCLVRLLAGAGERHVAAEILLEVIEGALPKLRLMSGFQRRALESILQAVELEPARGTERGVVVTASTGAGKTYAFFLPILAKIVIERCLRRRVGVKAICIYPRVALSENQLTDFVEVLFHLNRVLERRSLPPITIGIESGAAVYRSSELQRAAPAQRSRLAIVRGWSYSEEHSGYLAPFAYCVGAEGQRCNKAPQRLMVVPAQPQLLRCPICGITYPFILFARDVMRTHPPDILIATTESLNRRLLSSTYQYLFGTTQFAAPSIVMLDEIHLQTSTAGTQVALLLRRLLARIRLGKQERGDPANLAFVGLSATIAQPVQFLAELTGLPVPRISEVKPNDDEMQVIGAERFIFVRAEDSEDTAVISTLIQTAMCILHNMPQPPSDGALTTYRSFGFVQSLDLVGRWLYQMQDAEKTTWDGRRRRTEYRTQQQPVAQWPIRDVPLYVYRYPPFNRQLFPAYFGPGANDDCNCEHHGPNAACRFFQAGECWWALSQRSRALQRPLNIKRKSGADRDKPIEADDDLIITTSALEVGYDDEALMCVLQYTAPTNVASFVQRKGRGGRKVGTRPIVATVLSPYKSTDLFLFRNHHLLTDPVFRKLPLNAQNRYLQRIHGFYALFDWLAYRASRDGSTLDFDRLSLPDFVYLLRQAADADVLLAFKDYLRRTFDMSVDALQRVLAEESEGLLMQILADSLVKQAHLQFTREQAAQVEPRELLRSLLPENLFSDINLPEVRVYYRPDSRNVAQRPSSESISLALSETIPGNVTFRGGQGATWVPPLGVQVDDQRSLVAVTPYYKELEELREQPDTANLPRRALRMVGIDPLRVRELTVYRPSAIEPMQFSRDHNNAYWYANPETGTLHEHRDHHEAGQDVQRLAHSTSAYPIGATDISSRRRTPTPDYTFAATHPSVALDPVGRRLVGQIVLHSDEPTNLNMLKVQRIILGSQYTLKFHESREDEVRRAVGFCLDETGSTQCALGYQMNTEGLMLELSPQVRDGFEPSSDAQARLRANATLHRFITELTVAHGENYFVAENLAVVLLTMADRWCNEQGEALDGLRQWFSASNGEFNRRLVETVGDIHQLSDKKAQAVHQLLDGDGYLGLFLDIYAASMPGAPLYQQYLRDTFQLSATIALKQLAQEVAGVEALNYVAAWTELAADFDRLAADRVWLYEIGVGGIGVMRATHDMLRSAPDRLWTELAHKLARCPTAQEEAFLRHLLAQPVSWLEQCEGLVGEVMRASSAGQRQVALEHLLTAVRHQLGVPVPLEQVRALLRVFIPDYVQIVDGQQLVNWQLFREINLEFLPHCHQRLGRDPSFAETRALLYRAVSNATHDGQESPYPELRRLMRLYEEEHRPARDTAPARAQAEREVRKAFENAVERRLLMTCRGACPTCLDDRSGEIEAPGMARLLLSRSLMAEWVEHVRAGQTLQVGPPDSPARVAERLRQIFEQGGRVIYLRVSGDHLAALCSAISYLTDAGVDTALGLVYPMITNVQTIYPDDPDERALVEVTVRPIE